MPVCKKTTLALLMMLLSSPTALFAQSAAPAAAPAVAPISQDELEQIVAPIALYPDSLMTQVLMASTYPLEVVEADRFAKANPTLTGDALAAALDKQTWDPSVRSLVNFPTVLDMMSTNLDATGKLGDAFIADQKRVLDAVQKLRAKAQAAGNLKTTEQQTVSVTQQASAQVIVIQPASPTVIYVPTYNPVVVYGAWPYPAYPPYYYRPPGYVVGAAIGFGVGFACGAAWGYAWGNCNWGRGNVNINVNQNVNFNRNINRNNFQTQINNRGGGGTWQHDPAHRQGVAYRDSATAKKFGGTSANQAVQARDSFRGRADAGRQDLNRGGADQFRGNGAAANTPARGNLGGGNGGIQNRGNGGGNGGGAQNRPASTPARGGAFDGVGSSGNAARTDSQRGAASRSGSFGGGGARAGGGGGGARGGGGGGRGR
jgi:Protein of unknown function (DUF3300)